MARIMRTRAVVLLWVICCTLVLSGCATLRHPVPKDLVMKAQVGTMDDIRVFIGESGTQMQESLIESIKQERPEDYPAGADGIKVYPVLAISGGGANGAYGAGLLKGWSEEGSRPKFKLITGVSTGAIIAPFAFLGKDYDAALEKVYTCMSTKDVMRSRGVLGVLFGDSLASNRPLAKQIAAIADAQTLEKIAVEHRHGRRLFVGTCDIDAQKLVIWDMGAIAVKGDVELFRRVILASAAIPVVFPPSIFHVDADGKSYDELHTDGGTLTQVFTTYALLQGMQGAVKEMGIDPTKIKAKLYIIRNGYMSARYKEVKDNFESLAGRCFDTIIDSQGVGDAYRIYVFTKKRGNDYNLAYIPPDFVDESKEMFDRAAMRKLFDRGYQDAVSGYKWHKCPPGLDDKKPEPCEME